MAILQMSNITTMDVNMTSYGEELMTSSNTTFDMVSMATFWIEGVLTPAVSLCGLTGMLQLNTTKLHKERDNQKFETELIKNHQTSLIIPPVPR